jgi:hypothetical protein
MVAVRSFPSFFHRENTTGTHPHLEEILFEFSRNLKSLALFVSLECSRLDSVKLVSLSDRKSRNSVELYKKSMSKTCIVE